jgi:gliding motility-associated-like protein
MKVIAWILGFFFYTANLSAQSFCSNPKIQRHTTISAPSVSKIQPHAIVSAVGGGFWATGTITTTADKFDFMVAKFNDSGRLVILKRLGTSGDETSYPIGLAPTSSGGCVIGGRSDDPSIGAGLAALGYIRSDGTLKWWRRTTSKGNSGRYDAFRNVLVRKDGTVFGCGSSHQWNYDSQLLLAAVDSNGNEIFRNSYRYGSQTHMDASTEFGSGYAVGGHDGSSPVLLTVTSAGEVDKFYGYSSPNYCPIVSITTAPSGKIYATGGYLVGSQYELWVACINPKDGKFIWQKRYSHSYTFGSKIAWIDDRLMVSFNQTSNGSNWSNGFAEIDSNGNPLTVRLVKFNTQSFENHLAGLNVANSPTGGWAFIGANASASANMSLSLLNPCNSEFCTIIKSKFNSVNNTPITLTSNKGAMYYDGKFATNQTPFLKSVGFTQLNNCVACSKPIPTAFRDSLKCLGDSVTYFIADWASSAVWSDGDTSHVKKIKSAGIYILKLSNACGTYSDTLEIKNFPEVTKVLIEKVQICKGETVNINANQPINANCTYTWNDGFNGAQRDITQPGTYILNTSDFCGYRLDTLIVTFKLTNKPIKLKDTFFCSVPNLFTQKISDYSVSILWNDGDTSHIKAFSNTGKYYVTIFNSCGSYTDSFEIIRKELPVKVLQENEYFCQGSWITLKGRQPSTGVFDYEWDTGLKGPELVAKNKSTFTLITRNACGSRSDQVNVYMANCDCEICIPNAFTPTNSDGRNDVFKPSLDCKYTNCLVKNSYMRIYNKWGEKLHDAPVTEGWDGTFMGSLVPEGEYIYLVYIVFDSQVYGNRIQSKSGVFTLLSGKN